MTARFVAEYSIQLSYECKWRLINQITSGHCILLLEVSGASEDLLKPGSFLKRHLHHCKQHLNGALDRIRTCDRSVRSRVLYPAELRVHLLPRIIGRQIFL